MIGGPYKRDPNRRQVVFYCGAELAERLDRVYESQIFRSTQTSFIEGLLALGLDSLDRETGRADKPNK
jgi:hypothetical protein